MNTTSRSISAGWLQTFAGLAFVATLGAGCGDPFYDDGENQDGVVADNDIVGKLDGALGDADDGCPGALGCPCDKAEACESGYCDQAAPDKPVCAQPCETGGVAGCDDNNPCTVDVCDASTDKDTASTCSHKVATDGAGCDDGDPCTAADACLGGTCSGAALDCEDNNPCTVDSCDKATGCAHAPVDGAACSDGDACTGDAAKADVCKAGACSAGAAVVCDDGNPCTSDTCDKKKGCGFKALDGVECQDGSLCTGTAKAGDSCVKGVCEPGAPVVCDDKNPCTADACEAAVGCTATDADSTPCDDGSACTVGSACLSGACVGGEALNCDDGNPCTTDTCDPDGQSSGTKGCGNKPLDGTACDDGSACTGADTGDSCVKGVCTAGAPVNCDDANPCTKDACAPKTGCVVSNDDGALCVPATGDKCDTGGKCKDAACEVVQQVGCDDGNPCTTDACNKSSGVCDHVAQSDGAQCSDGNPCTSGDACQGGVCKAQPTVCDDGNPCTADACDPAPASGPGGCTTAPLDGKVCSDGTVCTSGDGCKGGKCQPGEPLKCDDGNPCTTDSCDKATGCASAKKEGDCDDGNACTAADACKAGWCQPGALKVCDDGNTCTTDSCDSKSGCVHTQVATPCNDGNLCTVSDVCVAGSCKAGGPQSCDDNNACTTDSCDPKAGCKSVTTNDKCSDGDVCTVGDSCQGDVCVPGAEVKVCNDKNPCTVDACDPAKGCVYGDSLNPCTDDDACTVGDFCKAGACTSGPAQQCDDGNPCTDDSCDKLKGCVQPANNKPCDDGDKCTLGDACKSGYCQGGGASAVCDDKNGCTDDFCDPVKGCTAVLTTKLCDDGDACTVDDACQKGTCKGGKALDCDDANTCTDDVCDKLKGCKHTVNSANPFTPWIDSGAKDSGNWAFAASTGAVAFGYVGAGYYRMAAGTAGTVYTMTLKQPVDLACTGAPHLYAIERSAALKADIEVSLDGKTWKGLAGHTAADHVWRRGYWDLSAYKGQKLHLRFVATVTSSAQWWDIRGLEIREKEALPKKVAWGTPFKCDDLAYEGPAFSCDASESPYQVRYNGVVQEPDTNVHANVARIDLLFDTKGVANPAVRFEERSSGGGLWVDVREPEGVWKEVYARGVVTDYVWRPREVYLTAFKGKVLEVRLRATMSSTAWTHVRNVAMIDKAPPSLPELVKAPVDLKACADWTMDGTAWICDDAQTIFKLAYVGDPAVDYNTNSYYHATLYDKRVDLSGLTAPELTFEHRYLSGTMYVELSTDGKAYTSVYSHGNGSDYVWRAAQVDLGAWKDKKLPIYLRIRVLTYYPTTWGHLRNIRIQAAPKPLETVAYGTKLNSCGWWSWEGPSWKCDPTETNWLFRADAVSAEPNPGGYWQYNTLQRWVSVPATGDPSFQFEVRRHYSYVSLQVSADGKGWTTATYDQNNSADYVWRPMRVKLAAYKGKKIMIRIGVLPRDYGKWLEIRKLSFQEYIDWPTVPFGGTTLCQDWDFQGTAWSCGTGAADYQLRYTGTAEQPSPNTMYHYATRKALLDLAKTTNPTVYFEARRSYGYLRFFVWGEEDSYQQLLDTGGGGLPFWRRYAIDLTKFAGRKIFMRFGALPYSESASGEIRNLALKEREPVVVVKYNHIFKAGDWRAEGGWSYDEKSGQYELDDSVPLHYQHMDSVPMIDLKGLISPRLSFKEKVNNVTRVVFVSEDGEAWTAVYSVGATYDPVDRTRTFDLGAWKDKKIFLRLRGYMSAENYWWRLHDLSLHDEAVIPTVAAGTVLSKQQFDAEGLWQWYEIDKAWAMNLGVDGSTQDKLLLSVYQALTATVAFDITKLKTPTLIYEGRGTAASSYRRIWLSVDGGDFVYHGYWAYESRPDVYLRRTWDLSGVGAKKTIRVRFDGYPSTNDYNWAVRNVRMDEPPVLTIVKPGYIIKPTDWLMLGDWKNAGTFAEASLTQAGGTHWLMLQDKAYDLSGVAKPVLTFEESYVKCQRYVQCSINGGLSWVTVASWADSAQQAAFKQRVVKLDACGSKPEVQVRFVSTAHYNLGEVWRIRNAVVTTD